MDEYFLYDWMTSHTTLRENGSTPLNKIINDERASERRREGKGREGNVRRRFVEHDDGRISY